MSHLKELEEIRKRLVEAKKLKMKEETAAAGLTSASPAAEEGTSKANQLTHPTAINQVKTEAEQQTSILTQPPAPLPTQILEQAPINPLASMSSHPQPFWTAQVQKPELRVKPPSRRNPQRPPEQKRTEHNQVAQNKDTQVRVNNKNRLRNKQSEAEKAPSQTRPPSIGIVNPPENTQIIPSRSQQLHLNPSSSPSIEHPIVQPSESPFLIRPQPEQPMREAGQIDELEERNVKDAIDRQRKKTAESGLSFNETDKKQRILKKILFKQAEALKLAARSLEQSLRSLDNLAQMKRRGELPLVILQRLHLLRRIIR